MTAEQLISLVRNRVGMRFHKEVVRFNIGRAYADLLNREADLTQYRKPYESVAVTLNSSTNRYYSLLPVTPINHFDAIRIYTMKGDKFNFVPVADGEMRVFEELDAGLATDVVSFYRRNDRVWYHNMPPSITTVLMEVAPPFELFADADTVYLPVGGEVAIIEKATEYMIGAPLPDKLND